MSKMKKFWLFGTDDNEPAEDFDADYDSIYYGDSDNTADDGKNGEVTSDDLYMTGYDTAGVSDVHIVTPEKTEISVADKKEPPKPEPEQDEPAEEYLYKVTYTPERYTDSPDIVDAFMNGRVVVINAEELDKENFLRMFDYIMGAVQALEGDIRKIRGKTVVLLPEGTDPNIDIDEIEEEPYGDYEDDDYDNDYKDDDDNDGDDEDDEDFD